MTCMACNGTGLWRNRRNYKCYKCNGLGVIKNRPAASAQVIPSIPVDGSKLLLAFEAAQKNRFETVKLRYEGLAFKPSPRRPSLIMVLNPNRSYPDDLIGYLHADRFDPNHRWLPELLPEMERILADPELEAILYSQRVHRCCICGIRLTNPVSVRRGIGPICAGKVGWFDGEETPPRLRAQLEAAPTLDPFSESDINSLLGLKE